VAALRAYRWPGNVRELRNVIERGLILSQGRQIGLEHLPVAVAMVGGSPNAPAAGEMVSLDTLEETHIRRVLARTKSLEEAAEVLGIDVATLWRRRKKYGI
jgi:NtrC-family two-component system response regulator AlgB